MWRYQKQLNLNEHNHPYLLPILRRYIYKEIALEETYALIEMNGGLLNIDPKMLDTLTRLEKQTNESMEMIHRVRDHDKTKTTFSLTKMLRKSIKPGEEILITQAESEGVGEFTDGWRQKNLYKQVLNKEGETHNSRSKP